ncbi:MAG: RdgB/HAM1 family non-canonical purine NTP pyrophosphatase [Planctomycetes bacterium]|nr:RdgB/HAM1 family non-canonical purine NTP pyrophosphatase [Planctomycetota bacterium]
MKTLVLGTQNKHKLTEIREILLDVPLRLNGLPVGTPEAPEDQPTLEGNAVQKAVAYAGHVKTWVLADDTGLEVDALEGRPGVHSARYAGEDCSDADNRALLLKELEGVPATRRKARFRCVVALCNPAGEVLATAEGVCEGMILEEARGEGGFGYDRIFRADSIGKTLAEITPDEKNRLSHRGAALKALKPRLLELL